MAHVSVQSYTWTQDAKQGIEAKYLGLYSLKVKVEVHLANLDAFHI